MVCFVEDRLRRNRQKNSVQDSYMMLGFFALRWSYSSCRNASKKTHKMAGDARQFNLVRFIRSHGQPCPIQCAIDLMWAR